MHTNSRHSERSWPVWGHPHAVAALRGAASREPRHAYILSGYEHLGKTLLATTFAKALLCPSPIAPGVPCQACSTCRRIDRGTHPDVSRYDVAWQASNSERPGAGKNLSLTIDTVRALSANLSLRPVETPYRVVIVDDVETMQEAAQEAFLKSLEEPPPYAVVLLLTDDAELLLDTIRSRASTIQLQSVRGQVITDMLINRDIEASRAAQIASAAAGRPGWAVLAAEDNELLANADERADAARAWIRATRYQQLVEATRLGEMYPKDRAAVFERLQTLQLVWRHELMHALEDEHRARELLEALRSVQQCVNDLDANVRPRLALQQMVLSWPASTTT